MAKFVVFKITQQGRNAIEWINDAQSGTAVQQLLVVFSFFLHNDYESCFKSLAHANCFVFSY